MSNNVKLYINKDQTPFEYDRLIAQAVADGQIELAHWIIDLKEKSIRKRKKEVRKSNQRQKAYERKREVSGKSVIKSDSGNYSWFGNHHYMNNPMGNGRKR